MSATGADEAEVLFDRYFPGIVMSSPGEERFGVRLDVFVGDGDADLTMSEHTISGPMTVQVDGTDGVTIALADVEGELTSGRDVIDVSQPWVVPAGQAADTSFTHTRMLTISENALDRVLRPLPGGPGSGRFRFTGLSPLSPAHGELWRSALSTTEQAMASGAIDNPLIARSLTEYVTTVALATFRHNWEEPPHGSTAVSTAAVRRARTFIEEHAPEPISLSDIAVAARLSSRQLHDVFRRHCDTTPMAYLHTVRLSGARDELIGSNPSEGTTVADIARRWGFAHPSRFALRYREAYGETPSTTLRR